MSPQDLLDEVRRWDEAASVLPATPTTITFGDYQVHELLGRLRCRVLHAAEQHPEGAEALSALFRSEGNRRWVIMLEEVRRAPWFMGHVLATLWEVP